MTMTIELMYGPMQYVIYQSLAFYKAYPPIVIFVVVVYAKNNFNKLIRIEIVHYYYSKLNEDAPKSSRILKF